MGNINLISFNVIALIIWYIILPFVGKTEIIQFGDIDYDISRLLGIAIVYINTIFVFFTDFSKIPKPVCVSAIIFMTYAAINVIINDNFIKSLYVLVRVYSGFLLLFIFCGANEKQIRLIEIMLLSIGAFTACYIIGQFALYKINPGYAIQLMGERALVPSYSYDVVRPQGPILSAGGSSSVISLALILLLRKMLIGELSRWHVVLGSFMTLALLLNFTRTYVFIIFLIFFINLIFYKKYKALTIVLMIFVMVITVSFVFLSSSHYTDRFEDLPGIASKGVVKEQLMQGRLLLIDIVWKDFVKQNIYRKLFGNGLYYPYKLLGNYFYGQEVSTHNDFMWLLSTMGIIGLILYILFYISAAISYQGEYVVLFLSFLIGMLFLNGLGGETISTTGHRLYQMIALAFFYDINRSKEMLNVRKNMDNNINIDEVVFKENKYKKV